MALMWSSKRRRMRWREGGRSGRHVGCAESSIIPTWPHRIHSSTSKMTLGSVGKPLSEAQAKISLNERHLDHAAEVLGRLVESREYPPAFLEPADQALHDASPPVRLAIELHRPGFAILVLLRRNYRSDAQLQQELVDPSGPIPLVAGHGDRPRHRFAVAVDHLLVCPLQQGDQGRVFVCLPRRQMEVEGMAKTIPKQVDLRGKSPAGTPQGVVRGLLGGLFFSASSGTAGGPHHRAVNAP